MLEPCLSEPVGSTTPPSRVQELLSERDVLNVFDPFSASADASSSSSKGPAVLLVTVEACKPCAPARRAFEQAADLIAKSTATPCIPFYSLDIRKTPVKGFAAKFNITSVPFFLGRRDDGSFDILFCCAADGVPKRTPEGIVSWAKTLVTNTKIAHFRDRKRNSDEHISGDRGAASDSDNSKASGSTSVSDSASSPLFELVIKVKTDSLKDVIALTDLCSKRGIEFAPCPNAMSSESTDALHDALINLRACSSDLLKFAQFHVLAEDVRTGKRGNTSALTAEQRALGGEERDALMLLSTVAQHYHIDETGTRELVGALASGEPCPHASPSLF